MTQSCFFQCSTVASGRGLSPQACANEVSCVEIQAGFFARKSRHWRSVPTGRAPTWRDFLSGTKSTAPFGTRVQCTPSWRISDWATIDWLEARGTGASDITVWERLEREPLCCFSLSSCAVVGATTTRGSAKEVAARAIQRMDAFMLGGDLGVWGRVASLE